MEKVYVIRRKKTGAYVVSTSSRIRCSHKKARIYDDYSIAKFAYTSESITKDDFEITELPLAKLKNQELAKKLSESGWFYNFVVEVK